MLDKLRAVDRRNQKLPLSARMGKCPCVLGNEICAPRIGPYISRIVSPAECSSTPTTMRPDEKNQKPPFLRAKIPDFETTLNETLPPRE